jgi:hypothetical protein
MAHEDQFEPLKEYLLKVPGITPPIGSGLLDDGGWWMKFSIDVNHRLAWNVVQELGHVLNYISLNERLPTVFMPVSPPPYMNGGPSHFLSWVIECRSSEFGPGACMEWLEGRLPRPVENESLWERENDA